MTHHASSRRPSLELDGTWDFVQDPKAERKVFDLPLGIPIQVPGSWEAQVPGRYGIETGWYRRSVTIPLDWHGRQCVVRFGAVMYSCEIWLNDELVGAHVGGFTPFEIELTAAVLWGEPNLLVVRVSNPINALAEYPPLPLDQILFAKDKLKRLPLADAPHGKQTWYSSLSGIWQSVRLECRPHRSIDRVRVFPDVAGQRALVHFSLRGEVADAVEFTITDPHGTLVARQSIDSPGASGDVTLAVASPTLWGIGAPNLYRLDMWLVDGGRPTDWATVRFGMREITTAEGEILLNGEPIVLMGALDQDLYPLGMSAPANGREAIKAQFAQAVAMGLNLIRCHIKVPDPSYLEAADEAGILLWCEVPSWTHFSIEAAAAGRDTLAEMVASMGNHPSIVIWTIINEDWGTRLKDESRDRRWLQLTYEWLKQLDPTRLIVDNSACDTSGKPNFHVKTDLADFHAYFSIPDKAVRWRNLMTDFAGRPAWLWSPHGDAISRGNEPLVLSEFGNWGLPRFSQWSDAPNDGDPWWLQTGGPLYRPAGALGRFKEFGLERVWASPDALADATQWHQFEALQYQIGELRRHPTIVGYVITELTDAYWEANGLLDISRQPKVYFDRLREINARDLVIPELGRRDLWGGQELSVPITLSCYGRPSEGGGRVDLDVTVDGKTLVRQQWSFKDWPRHTAIPIARAQITLPEVSHANRAAVVIRAIDASGALRSRDERTICLVPSSARRTSRPLRVCVEDPMQIWGIEGRLVELGHVLAGAVDADLLVTSELSPAIVRHADEGGRVLLLVRSRSAIDPELRLSRPISVHPRWLADDTGTDPRNPWKGDWISTYNWILPGNFTGLPEQNPLDFAYEEVAPDHVLLGYEPGVHRDEVPAGMFAGWLHAPAALIWTFPQGEGQITVTTFKLAPECGPVATVMLEGLIAGDRLSGEPTPSGTWRRPLPA